ncbi:TetR family transcriptional regulator [Actinomadura sp. LD22]|uniref:TetR family transcriptional regulator n=1 Tax=Actinomadura physcomitrii TaxID=2650748 RepID=A0A6I4M659_9ACTN|nr:TetR family transcriptional regulator [Actinomadura physcomitrii]MVZ99773.1 TetR family transcriptional regulator [Actinomadura physcomitrii]
MTKERSPAERRADRLARHERILDAGLETFAAEGYRGTTLDEIAVRVGLTKTGVAHHFPANAAVKGGFLTPGDAATIVANARKSSIGR